MPLAEQGLPTSKGPCGWMGRTGTGTGGNDLEGTELSTSVDAVSTMAEINLV